jgi:chitodextrinase
VIDGQDLTLARIAETNNYAVNWLPSKYGSFELTVTATDNEGLSNNKIIQLSVISPDTCTLPAWNASVVYEINNTRVEYLGYAYENKYYITGEAPNQEGEDYDVWTKLGKCLDL